MGTIEGAVFDVEWFTGWLKTLTDEELDEVIQAAEEEIQATQGKVSHRL